MSQQTEKFTMSPDRMRDTAKSFNDNADTISISLKNLENSVNDLLSEWDGAGAHEFEGDFTSLKTACEKMMGCVTERATALTSSANAADELAGKIRDQWA